MKIIIEVLKINYEYNLLYIGNYVLLAKLNKVWPIFNVTLCHFEACSKLFFGTKNIF